MSSTEIHIEHLNDRWVADVEVGGAVARRRPGITAPDFEGIMRAVVDAYLELVPVEVVVRPPMPEPPPLMPVEATHVKSRGEIAAQRGIGSEIHWRGARRAR